MTSAAAQSAFRTASSLASTVAPKSGSSSESGSECSAARRPNSGRGRRPEVANARKISPLPWCATEPVRPRPSPARRASRVSCAGASGASVATIAMQLPAGGRTPASGSGSARPAGTPSIRRSGAEPKFASTRTPTVAPGLGLEPAGRADAALPAEAGHARAGADRALGDRAAARPRQRPSGVLRLDLHDGAVGEPAVVALRHDRDDDVLGPDGGIGGDRRGDGAVEDAPDGHRRGEVDRRLDQSPLGDRHAAGHLPRPVEHRRPGRDGLAKEPLGGSRQDRGHARARDPAPAGLVAPDRDMADLHAGDVGDRVLRPRLERADPQPQLAQARTSRCWRAGHGAQP